MFLLLFLSVLLCFNVGQVLESCTFLSNCNVICFVSFICTFQQINKTLTQRILRQIRIETHQSEHRETDQSGDWNKAGCKRVVVAVGNCTRAMCVRARRCLCSSAESARSPPQRLYIYQAGWSQKPFFSDRAVNVACCISRVAWWRNGRASDL